jgi:hypothetical protein
MSLKVAEFRRPDGSEDLARHLRDLADRAEAGEIVSVLFAAICANGDWFNGSRGKAIDTLTAVGILEGIKIDLLTQAKK